MSLGTLILRTHHCRYHYGYGENKTFCWFFNRGTFVTYGGALKGLMETLVYNCIKLYT